MHLIESNVGGSGLPLRIVKNCSSPRPIVGRRCRDASSASVKASVLPSEDEGPLALNAAELADIESEKTCEKMKNKAEHVASFHRKVVKRVADERRGSDVLIRPRGAPRTRVIYSAVGNSFGSTGVIRDCEDWSPWQHPSILWNEASIRPFIKVKGKYGDVKSLSDADKEARMTLAEYRVLP